jgi:uncharacterized alkaline shock family protein YloU
MCWILKECMRIYQTGKEYTMKGRINSELGEVVINPDVIATYAGSVAVECFGIVGMAIFNVKDGLVRLLKKDSLERGLNVRIEDNKITIDFHVIVSYGVSISAVADNLFGNVKYRVEEFTGMEVEKINMYVEGVRVID